MKTNDPITNLWQHPANQSDSHHPLAEEVTRLFRSLRRQQLRHTLWLGWTICLLTVFSILLIREIWQHGFSQFADQGLIWPLFVLPWLVALAFLAQLLRSIAPRIDPACPLSEALAVAAQRNAAEGRRLTLIGTLIAVFVPLTAGAISQLEAVGKLSASDAIAMKLVFGAGLLIGAGVVLFRWLARLRPERAKIHRLMADLEDSAASEGS